MKQIHRTAPVFLVADVVKSAEYYKNVLGFNYEKLWGDPPDFCMPKRDGIIVMLNIIHDKTRITPNAKAMEVHVGWDAYFWIEDADKLFTEFKNNGAFIAYEPVIKHYYKMKEFAVRDMDGYVLAFGQSLE